MFLPTKRDDIPAGTSSGISVYDFHVGGVLPAADRDRFSRDHTGYVLYRSAGFQKLGSPFPSSGYCWVILSETCPWYRVLLNGELYSLHWRGPDNPTCYRVGTTGNCLWYNDTLVDFVATPKRFFSPEELTVVLPTDPVTYAYSGTQWWEQTKNGAASPRVEGIYRERGAGRPWNSSETTWIGGSVDWQGWLKILTDDHNVQNQDAGDLFGRYTWVHRSAEVETSVVPPATEPSALAAVTIALDDFPESPGQYLYVGQESWTDEDHDENWYGLAADAGGDTYILGEGAPTYGDYEGNRIWSHDIWWVESAGLYAIGHYGETTGWWQSSSLNRSGATTFTRVWTASSEDWYPDDITLVFGGYSGSENNDYRHTYIVAPMFDGAEQ